MDDLEASFVVYEPPEEVYRRLFEFTRYRRYSEYVEDVRIAGEGVGTRFAITFAWWRIDYTLRGRVTDVDPPERIDWEITRDVNARGYWSIEPVPEQAPEGEDHATRARLRASFDPDSAKLGRLDVPRFVPTSKVIEKLTPLVRPEARRIASRAVADIEGRRRQVDLEIHTYPDSF